MKYPEYRQAEMPVTTAWMESLVKEMNYREKGTEMFGTTPREPRQFSGACRCLCDDDR